MVQYRLDNRGRVLNRAKPINFVFDDKDYEGFAGDTVASALLAEGVQVFGRSFKYHRRRGVMTANEAEACALMTIIYEDGTREPNRPATMIPITEGLEVASQNRFPSLKFDMMGINNLFSKFLPAGFYYKTFMGPMKKSWMWFEPFIRRAAGLGAANYEPDNQQYDHYAAHPQVLIIGSGACGLQTAYKLGKAGVKVLLLEQAVNLGGQLLASAKNSEDEAWLDTITSALEEMDNVQIATETSAFGWYDHNIIGALEQAKDGMSMRLWRIYADKVVLASGAMERPIAFGNNDLPNIMLSSSLRFYMNAQGVLTGMRIVLFANDDSAYQTAFEIKDINDELLVAIVDIRAKESIGAGLVERAETLDITLHLSKAIIEAHGTEAVRAVDIVSYDIDEGIIGRDYLQLPCDVLAVAGGWTPTLHLHSQTGNKPIYDKKIFAFVPQPKAADGQYCIGGCNGTYGRKDMQKEVDNTVKHILSSLGKKSASKDSPALPEDNYKGVSTPVFYVKAFASHRQGKIFLDMQNDVTLSDIEIANLEGYDSVEHMKRYTTLGMATDQGKNSNMAAFHILADLQSKSVEELGTTTFRPAYTSVPIGAFAGREIGSHFRPLRKIPLHDWHLEKGAKMINTVAWQRPWYYPSPDLENEDVNSAYIREMTHVRQEVGMVDVSTLGKIAVSGPDAAEFLNRVYVNGFKTLKIGRCRYGVMLRDDGFVLDDGTVTRISEHEYLMTTTTVEAEVVFRKLEFLLECEWQDLRVHIVSVSDEWCGLALAGPKARSVLHALVSDDLSDEALPFMGYIEGNLRADNSTVRIFRISFSGELGYELYVRRSQARLLADACFEAGSKYNLGLYGLEAMGGLRIEKGFLTAAEIDGRHSLKDLGLQKMASSKKDFIGRSLSMRDEFDSAERPQLVGLVAMDKYAKFRNGALVYDETGLTNGHGIGHVTSVTWSPTLERYIALAFVAGGLEKHKGEKLRVSFPLKNEMLSADVTDLDFLKEVSP